MPKKNYRRGYDAEDRCLKELRAAGYWAERFHASKGTFDVVAAKIGGSGYIYRLIQVKRSKRYIKSVEAVANEYSEDIVKMREMPAPSELWVWFDTKITDGKVERKPGWRKFIIQKLQVVEVP